MNYAVKAKSTSNRQASYIVKEANFSFGITKEQDQLPNPAELLLGAFAACCLKNIERFSDILKFEYEQAEIEVIGELQESPTKLNAINYLISIKGANININLLHKNIQKFGTIYNTLKETCQISGEIKLV